MIRRFHPLEQKLYRDTKEEERERLYHDLWVLKESFMKAEGSGLGISLDSFYMEEISRGTGRVCQSRNEKDYYYMLYRLEDMPFSLGVCSEEAVFAKEPFQLSAFGSGFFAGSLIE